ncbi:MAG: hypothetical protein OEX07_11905, partial [Gammaproteobacteria bacterium]|nr:hypothetical protein [Gammaproteobacteria bacterium]
MFSKSISYALLLTSTLGLTLLLNACGEGASGPGISPGDAINIIDRKPNYTCDTSNINQKIPTDNNNKITQDTTIGPGCFYANNYVIIDDGAQLTINPDTILQFKTLTGLVVDNGNINANGLPDKPIYFTGEFKTENTAWSGILIRGRSQSFRPNIFNYTLNEYSGARRPKTTEDDTASISFNDTFANKKNDQKPRIIFTNNVIRKSSGKYAFNASNYSFFDKIENNIFYDNLFYPAIIDANESFKFNQSNRFSYNGIPNAINKLVINGDILNVLDRKEAHSAYEDPNALPITTITWKNLGIPYVIHSNIKVTSTILTIEPGTKLEFRQNAGLSIIGSNAALVSTGTPTAPITMTSEDLQLPQWHGL